MIAEGKNAVLKYICDRCPNSYYESVCWFKFPIHGATIKSFSPLVALFKWTGTSTE